MAQGCGCGCNGQKKMAPASRNVQRTGGLGRVRPGLSRGGLSQFNRQDPWLTIGPKGVELAGRNFTWQTVGGFVMQGALLFLLWTTIRNGQLEPRARSS